MNNEHPASIRWQFPPEYKLRSSQALDSALQQVELYRAWRSFDPGRQHDIDRRFAAMPALTKKDIRAHFPHVLPPAQDMDLGIATGEIQLVETSGTTDDKITNIWNQAWWDASERSSWKLNSHVMKLATGNHREAILVNARNVGFISDEVDLPMEGRRLSRFLYLNEKTDPLSWSHDIMDRMVAELRLFQPQVLEANPSMLARLSRYILQSGADVFQPGVIVFTYEYPTVFHCRQIGRVFNVPMVSSYGTTEVGYVFMQCEEGKLHQNIDYCRVDFQPFRPEHGGPMLGRILVTPFQNPWNYLVRFNTGDLVRLAENGRCKCGRDAGLILSSVQGRAVNLTMTMRGRIVTLAELDAHMSRLDGVDEYKLVQTDPQTYECHLSSHRRDRDRLQREASEIVKGLYGKDAKAPIVFEADIAPEMSGKYLISRALFPIDVEEYLDRRSDIGVEKTGT